jgi:hypothetical protein
MPQANSKRFVLPTISAPASRSRATALASVFGTCLANIAEP